MKQPKVTLHSVSQTRFKPVQHCVPDAQIMKTRQDVCLSKVAFVDVSTSGQYVCFTGNKRNLMKKIARNFIITWNLDHTQDTRQKVCNDT